MNRVLAVAWALVVVVLATPIAVGSPHSFAPLTVTASASPSTGPFPLNATLSANASGGWPSYTYEWSFGDGAPNASGPTVSHLYRWASTFVANVSVSDSVGEVTTTSVTVVTHAPPLAITLAAVPASVSIHNETFLETSVQGGTAPFVYAWSGLPGGCVALPAENLSCSPTQSGTFVIHVTVTDGLGQQVNATTLLLVTGPPARPAPTAAGSDLTPVIVGGLALGAVGVLAVVVLRRRRRPQ